MGSPIPGSIAEISLQYSDQLILKHVPQNKYIFYARCGYDIVIMYDHSNITSTQVLEYAITIHTDLQFKPTPETNVSINFLDLLLHRTNHGLTAEVYRKHTSTDTTIHHDSNRPIEHNLAAYRFLPNRIHQLPLTPPYKQKEWNKIQHNAKANAFPHALLVKLNAQVSQNPALSSTKDSPTTATTTPKAWLTLYLHDTKNHHFFRAFRTNNTIHNALHNRPRNTNILAQSGIYQLKCHTRNLSYIGQTNH